MEYLEYTSLDEGIVWVDIIFCCLPLTDQTKGMLDYQTVSASKKSPLLINISRGEITPIEDLKQLLQEEKIGGVPICFHVLKRFQGHPKDHGDTS